MPDSRCGTSATSISTPTPPREPTPDQPLVYDGRIELDTNIVERGIRPIVLNRKNALFAGHDEGAENWACIASLIETCKLNGVDPQAWLADVLARIAGHPAHRLDELLPWNWRANNKSATAFAA